MRLRVVTYNIHKGIGGVDRRYRIERIVQTLKHLSPDLVCLQEVDQGVPRSRHDEQAQLLGEALNFPHVAFQKNVRLRRGGYGNAILSRFPLDELGHVDLTIPLKKRRRALVARCQINTGGHRRTVWIASLHLGLAGFERVMQLRRLLGHPTLDRLHGRSSIILGGDYNDVWGSLGRQVMAPAGFHSVSEGTRTYPAIMPLRPLDRIFYRGPLRLHHAFAGHSRNARHASDHLPLVADFVFDQVDRVSRTQGR